MVDLEATLRASLDGQYAIEGEVGHGGMSVVYRAVDLKHNRTVAIKVLRPELSEQIGADRFQREIEVVAGLTHPHILPLHDSGEADGLLYYVMPFIDGESLRARVDRDGRLPLPDAIRITREIAGALGFAHRQGIIHRDVKPGNILLAEDHALLADFGVAHLAETDVGTLTGTGLALGTPSYFSPEQATGEQDIDGRSDIYSLGCVLYEALTGRPPFEGPNVRALIKSHVVDAPPRARELRHEVPEGLEAVVQTALQKEPERRFQTAEEMAGSLDLVSGGFEAMAAEALRRLLGPRYRWLHGRRLAALITAAALALVVTVLAVQTYVRGPSFSGPLATYVILPWTGGATTEQEAAIAERAARWLGVHLEDWESLRVVAEHALEGHLADIQLAGVGLPTYTLSTALSLAGQLGASHVVHVYATEVGDSVVLVTRITAREGPQESEQSFRGEGHEDELEVITAELALGMLGLFDEDVGYDDLVARSPNHLAHQEFQEGRQALRDWRLAEAERLFREALAQDSAFALAHHYLAQTLYWRTARDKERLWDLGPEIEHHSRRAVQYDVSGRLRPLERSHVDAFHAFWTGDFTGARARYDTLLALDPTDLEGLILRGSVELSDPWLVRERDGSLRPQLDLDLARAMYDSSARLSSTWQLAWGRLYDIDVMLARSAFRNDCLGFHPPDYEETLTPYSKGEASVVAMFCPLVDDGSIVWRAESLSDEDKARAQEGVRQTHEQTTARLERWALVEKDQPRHREELADWMLWERSLKGCAADPAEADSLARLALDHIQRALADRGDTTAEDRVRLAAIAMFDGELEEAARAMDEALDELGNWRSADGPTPPTAAVNPYLAAGDVQMAKAIIEAIFGANTAAFTDPADPDHAIDMTGSFAPLYMLDAIGYLGETGPEVQSVFETLADLWSDERYTDRERAILHWVGLDFAGPALVYFPDLWAEWLDDLGEQGLDMPAVWRGLRIADSRPEEALTALGEVLSDLQREREAQTLRATDYFLPIALAERTGSDSVSAELRRQALACPLALSHADFGWGMRRYLVGE